MARTKLYAAGGVLTAVLAVGVLAHVPQTRMLFASLSGGGGGCPFGGEGAKAPSPEKLEDHRVKSVAPLKAGTSSPAQPALHFTLGASTRAEVVAWTTEQKLACKDELGAGAWHCEAGESGEAHERGHEVGGRRIADMYFRFDPKGLLVATDVVHVQTNAANAATAMKTLASGLETKLGTAGTLRGEATAAFLGSGRMSRAAYEFRFADYAADVSATSLASSEDDPMNGDVVAVREQYRWLSSATVPTKTATR